MAESDFLGPQAQDEARRVIAAIERETSAEVVVTVRRVSGRYREADYLAGFLVSLVALVALLFVPREFALWSFPLDVALAFALGAWASSRIAPVRRFLTPRGVRLMAVRSAAHLAFADARLSRLPGRNAVLVYLSLFERDCVILTDLGVDTARLEPAWSEALSRVRVAIRLADWGRTLEALRGLGPALAKGYPRCAEDVNELPDEVTQA